MLVMIISILNDCGSKLETSQQIDGAQGNLHLGNEECSQPQDDFLGLSRATL